MPSKHGKGWRARWVDQRGERQSQTFTKKRDAEAFEHRKKAEAEEVRHGLRAERPASHSFAELCDYWLENRASRKRSKHHDESIIRKHFRPSFKGLNVADVGVLQVDRFVRDRDQLSPKTIGNLLTLLISMLNVAKDLSWIVALPRIRKPQVRLCDADFAFLRTEDEVARLLLAAHEEGEIVHALYATAIYTGMRKGELAALHWDDVDFERRLITVQRSFDGPTKAGDVRHVPIVNALLPCLRAWRLRTSNDLLFSNEVGSMRDPASRIFQETLHRVLNRAEFPRVSRAGKLRWYITFHGLRHTFASHWVMRSGELFKLQKILGHKSVQMTMRYAHLAPEAFSEDWDRFGGAVGTGGVLIKLQRKGSSGAADLPASMTLPVAGD
ncbi:MAG: site-specific integrase [Pseudomonadota bacterium]